MTNLTVIYGDTTLEVPNNTDMNALKTAMSDNFPELKNSTVTREGNVITFTAKAGTKGAIKMENLTVIYGDTTLEVPAGTDLAALKTAMSDNFPELKNADVQCEGNTITFQAKAGTKGAVDMLEVVYGDTTLQVPANTDLEALKSAMSDNFPELKNATVTREDNRIVFQAKAGTKGADLVVVYGDTTLTVPADTNLDALKSAMSDNFPELKNATISRDGDRVVFSAKAGTKGVDLVVVYGDTELTVPGNTDLEALKSAMADNFPELKNATISRDGDRVVFSAKAGTKGI